MLGTPGSGIQNYSLGWNEKNHKHIDLSQTQNLNFKNAGIKNNL